MTLANMGHGGLEAVSTVICMRAMGTEMRWVVFPFSL